MSPPATRFVAVAVCLGVLLVGMHSTPVTALVDCSTLNVTTQCASHSHCIPPNPREPCPYRCRERTCNELLTPVDCQAGIDRGMNCLLADNTCHDLIDGVPCERIGDAIDCEAQSVCKWVKSTSEDIYYCSRLAFGCVYSHTTESECNAEPHCQWSSSASQCQADYPTVSCRDLPVGFCPSFYCDATPFGCRENGFTATGNETCREYFNYHVNNTFTCPAGCVKESEDDYPFSCTDSCPANYTTGPEDYVYFSVRGYIFEAPNFKPNETFSGGDVLMGTNAAVHMVGPTYTGWNDYSVLLDGNNIRADFEGLAHETFLNQRGYTATVQFWHFGTRPGYHEALGFIKFWDTVIDIYIDHYDNIILIVSEPDRILNFSASKRSCLLTHPGKGPNVYDFDFLNTVSITYDILSGLVTVSNSKLGEQCLALFHPMEIPGHPVFEVGFDSRLSAHYSGAIATMHIENGVYTPLSYPNRPNSHFDFITNITNDGTYPLMPWSPPPPLTTPTDPTTPPTLNTTTPTHPTFNTTPHDPCATPPPPSPSVSSTIKNNPIIPVAFTVFGMIAGVMCVIAFTRFQRKKNVAPSPAEVEVDGMMLSTANGHRDVYF